MARLTRLKGEMLMFYTLLFIKDFTTFDLRALEVRNLNCGRISNEFNYKKSRQKIWEKLDFWEFTPLIFPNPQRT